MKTFVIILVVAALLIAGYMLWGRGTGTTVQIQTENNLVNNQPATTTPQASTSTPKSATTTGSTPSTGSGQASYTLAQVSAHNKASDCWSAINGSVYNLTSWISRHPGGQQAILGLCGKDGSQAFNKQHGDQDKPEKVLASFLIGTLKK